MNVKENEALFGKRNVLYTGRASTGIYLILIANEIKDKEVLFPANICYAPVFGAIYSGNKPVFLDINDWANVSIETIEQAISPSTKCMVIPHMYGKVNKDIEKIQKLCNENNIILIEDCASAMGASYKGKSVGSFGDYSIFSFDYSKIIEVGVGGVIASNKDLSKIENINSKLQLFNSDIDTSLALFSKIYRNVRNSCNNSLITSLYKFFNDALKDYFIFNLNKDKIYEINNACKNLQVILETRKQKYHYYEARLKDVTGIDVLLYEEIDAPWRFNFLFHGNKKEFINYLLEQSVPVSDWYPVISEMFQVKNSFTKATAIENEILNLPLLVADEAIDKYCTIIKEYKQN